MSTKRFNIYFGIHALMLLLVGPIVLFFPDSIAKAAGMKQTPVIGALMISSGINLLTLGLLVISGWRSKELKIRQLAMIALIVWNLATVYYDLRMGQASGQSMLSGMISHGLFGIWGLTLLFGFPEKSVTEPG